MADTTGYEEAKKRFEKAKEAYEKGRSSASTKEIQTLLADYYQARRDMQERTPSGALGAGFLRTAGDVVTGIPDLLTEGTNWLAKKSGAEYQAPTLGGLFRQATGQSEGPKAPELETSYNAPGYAAAAYGIASLTNLGFRGLKSLFDNRKVDTLLKKLPEAEQNTFKDLMLKGQGSANTEVQALINKVRANPKYAEIFNALDVAAAKRATEGLAPTASRISDQGAAVQAAKSVQNKLQGLAEARSTAGNLGFEKAFGYGEGRSLVDPTKTLAEIDKLIGRYSKQASPNAEKAVDVLKNIRERFQPTRQVAGTADVPVSTTRQVTGRDAAGMPITTDVPTSFTIPGSKGYSFQAAPQKLTVEEVQSILSEFGKKASSGDSLVKDLALSDEKIISAAVFGKMKDDLNVAFTTASGADRAALGFLQKARKDVEVASRQYNDAIAQGLPAWLKDKPLSSIDFEELMAQYSSVSPAQRATFREYVKANDPEALKNIDGRVWTDFKAKYTGKLPDGSQGTDLARMAQDWNKMGLQEKDAVANALGQNVSEFSTRMNDALVFTRKARTGGETETGAAADMINKAAAVVGSTPAGYSGAKMTQLGGGLLSTFRNGVISDELAMKTLMTPEGAAFLKQGKLTPGSMETLDKLMKTSGATAPTSLPLSNSAIVGGIVAPATQTQPVQAAVDDWVIPDEAMPATTTTTEDDWVIPD